MEENVTESSCKIIVADYTLALTVLSCTLSIFGTIIIVVTYISLTEIRNFTRKLLLALTVADFFTACGNLIGSIRYIYVKLQENGCKNIQVSDTVCVVQSFITTYSSMASFFWTTVIAVHIYLQIARRSSGMRTRCVVAAYHILSWGVPGVIIIAAATSGALGSDNSVGTGSWCWIKSDLEDKVQVIWMVVTGKGWEILCYFITAGLYILSKIEIWSQRREMQWRRFRLAEVEDMRDEDENFLYVPLVLYLLRIWGTSRFFIAVIQKHVNNVHLDRAQAVLLAFQSIGDSAQAFFNCILFCFCDVTVRTYLCSVLCRRRNTLDRTDDERAPINVTI